MKKIIFFMVCLCLYTSMPVYSFDKLPNARDFFISRNGDRMSNLPQYIKPDYIRDDYKRNLPDLSDDNLSFFQKYPLEVHMTSTFSYAAHANTFNMRDMFFEIGQTYHNSFLQLTGFITLNGYFDTHDPLSDYGYIKGNVGLYDGGIQAIFFDRILVSARGRANYDISTNTFMLMPHYYDTTLDVTDPLAAFYTNIPGFYLPQNMNGPGIRVGFIGKYYELAYSQGDFMHGIPKSLLARVNLPNMEFRLLYSHENRKAPASWTNDLSSNLVQFTSTFRFPFLQNKLWLNAIAEYTWRQNDEREVPTGSLSSTGNGTVDANGNILPFAPDAHYVRLEQAIEYYMLNLALREIIQVRDGVTRAYLEYAIYGKFQVATSEFTIGFQGSTDGRYYISGGIKF